MDQQENTNATRQQTRPIRVMLLDAHPTQSKIIAVTLGREGYSSLPSPYRYAWGDNGAFASFYPKYDVLVFADPAEALQRLYSQFPAPDLLILDTQIPRIDWSQIIRTCKETPRLQSLPIILIVQLDGKPGTLLKAKLSGAAGRLDTPVTTQHIRDEVRRIEHIHLQNTDIWS